ncbi:uncharacterized protein LOC124677859 isoform X4 [Lolium rigidum]|uniref:uncharacterized protein LOC124677859 isoform X4 n=1 Tax=Lolium rigidum TaxID=89674 RepID=UPI001F5DA1DA|nr:uncharacterized protein LOC124677859 isoform X4 [Lolium rigidum]
MEARSFINKAWRIRLAMDMAATVNRSLASMHRAYFSTSGESSTSGRVVRHVPSFEDSSEVSIKRSERKAKKKKKNKRKTKAAKESKLNKTSKKKKLSL